MPERGTGSALSSLTALQDSCLAAKPTSLGRHDQPAQDWQRHHRLPAEFQDLPPCPLRSLAMPDAGRRVSVLRLLRQTLGDLWAAQAMEWVAAVAFYGVLSVFPLLLAGAGLASWVSLAPVVAERLTPWSRVCSRRTSSTSRPSSREPSRHVARSDSSPSASSSSRAAAFLAPWSRHSIASRMWMTGRRP
jgi:hypothetical protein